MEMKPRGPQESSSVLRGDGRSPGPPNWRICLWRLQVVVATGRFADGSYSSPSILFSHQRKERRENLLRTHVLTGHLGLGTCTVKRLQELAFFFLSKTYF